MDFANEELRGNLARLFCSQLVKLLLPEVIERLVSFVNADPFLRDDRARFVLGLGWDQTIWPGGRFPTAVRTLRSRVHKAQGTYHDRVCRRIWTAIRS